MSIETPLRDVDVYLVGSRYSHHSTFSGYDGFRRYVGKTIETPLRFRYLDRAYRLDHAISALLRKPHYSATMFLTELRAALHMLVHRGAVYHLIYGDTDLRLLALFGRLTRVPVVATFHEPPFGLEWMKVDRSVTDGLAAVILVSHAQRSHFEGLVSPERLFVVPHGIDTEFFQPPAEPSPDPVCITVGSKYRDFDALSEAITIVREVYPNVRFLAIGTDVNTRTPLGDKRVTYMPSVDDAQLLAAYHSARLAVLPFKLATANNALLEAMACGLPLVTTDVGGVREYVGEDGAFICRPHDSESLARGMLMLLGDRALAERMGTANRRRALSFDYRSTAQLHREIYSLALETSRSEGAGA